MDKNREFHPAANLFPLLQGKAFEELVADIRRNGLREPILLDRDGRILDGRNRYRACLEAGVEPRFVTWEGEGSEVDLALSLNLKRRHLNESQRAMVAARLAEQISADVRKYGRGSTSARASKAVNVSTRLVEKALKILRDGCPELIASVDSGQLAVTPAGSLASLPQPEQAQVLAGGPAAIAAKVRELRGVKPATEPGQFGLVHVKDPVALFWVAGGTDHAIAALQARGFRYLPAAYPGDGTSHGPST